MTEQWKDIPGFEGRYQVSDLGRVRSLDHHVRIVRHGVEGLRLSRGRILRPGPCNTHDYITVTLAGGVTLGVHRVVALAFIGPRPEGADVAHNDGDPRNNRLSNLRYATRGSNNEDIFYHGRRRFSMDDIKRIRATAGLYIGAQTDLAREFGVTKGAINAIYARRSYAHVE